MENATKALLMAAGVLMALLIVGALLLMFNQLGSYQKTGAGIEKNSQLAAFNADFERYGDSSGIKGMDLVSLANKIVDYNQKQGTTSENANYVNYNIKISLKVTNMDQFRSKYGYSDPTKSLFKRDTYTIDNSNKTNSLKEILESYNCTDRVLLQQISTIYSKYDNDADREKYIKEALLRINSTEYSVWTLTNGKEPTRNQIKNYKEYSEFKTSKFECTKMDYKDGQINYLEFKFIK